MSWVQEEHPWMDKPIKCEWGSCQEGEATAHGVAEKFTRGPGQSCQQSWTNRKSLQRQWAVAGGVGGAKEVRILGTQLIEG